MQLEIAKRRLEELEVLGSMQFPGFTVLKQDGRGDGLKEGFVVDVSGDGSFLTAWMPEGYPLDGPLLCSSTGEGGREVLEAVQAAARDAALEGIGAEHGLQVCCYVFRRILRWCLVVVQFTFSFPVGHIGSTGRFCYCFR